MTKNQQERRLCQIFQEILLLIFLNLLLIPIASILSIQAHAPGIEKPGKEHEDLVTHGQTGKKGICSCFYANPRNAKSKDAA